MVNGRVCSMVDRRTKEGCREDEMGDGGHGGGRCGGGVKTSVGAERSP